MRWHVPAIPALNRCRQVYQFKVKYGYKFEAILGYVRPCLNFKKEKLKK